MAEANIDVVSEILLHLPVQSLLRCRAVCKLWRDVIDSPSFRQLHTTTRDNDNENDAVYLVLEFHGDDDDLKLSMDVIDMKRRRLSHDFNDAMPNSRSKHVSNPIWELEYDVAWFGTAVKGLLCFNFTKHEQQPISICNPFLGQMRTLPIPHNPCLSFTYPNTIAAIGFDDDDSGYYKVLQMSYCRKHRGLHARLYSTRTDSWRDLDGNNVVLDRDVRIDKSITSLPCNNGYFAHWKAASCEAGGDWEPMILTFDMKKEVFRSIALPDLFCIREEFAWFCSRAEFAATIIARDEYSFDLVVTPRADKGGVVRIFESTMCEGNERLRWNYVVDVREGVGRGIRPARLMSDYVVLKIPSWGGELRRHFYDYRARRFIRCHKIPKIPSNSEILAYRGTFISP